MTDVRGRALRDAIAVVERHCVDGAISAGAIDAVLDELRTLVETASPEKIVRAAIRHQGVVYDVPRPGRHHHVIRLICSMGKAGVGEGLGPVDPDDGFLTSHGRFVDRDEAYRLAEMSGQILDKTIPGHIPGHLFSEDLW